MDEGGLVAGEVVWAEAATFFPTAGAAAAAFETLGLRFVPMDAEDALEVKRAIVKHIGRTYF